MKIIQTLNSNLHTEIQTRMNKLTQKEQKRKEFQKNREEFMKRVHKTLKKNILK